MQVTRRVFGIIFILLAGSPFLKSQPAALPEVSLSLDKNPSQFTGDAIGGAKQSLSAIVYKFEDEAILTTLENALKRGVAVRLLMDSKEASGKKSLARKAQKAGAEVSLWGSKQEKLHAKCLIIDGREVISGSFNWTDSAGESNLEILLSFKNPATVKDFSAIFERLWEEGEPLK